MGVGRKGNTEKEGGKITPMMFDKASISYITYRSHTHKLKDVRSQFEQLVKLWILELSENYNIIKTLKSQLV